MHRWFISVVQSLRVVAALLTERHLGRATSVVIQFVVHTRLVEDGEQSLAIERFLTCSAALLEHAAVQFFQLFPGGYGLRALWAGLDVDDGGGMAQHCKRFIETVGLHQ